jgi:hypothetical protein
MFASSYQSEQQNVRSIHGIIYPTSIRLLALSLKYSVPLSVCVRTLCPTSTLVFLSVELVSTDALALFDVFVVFALVLRTSDKC